jgi:xanthine dehydrogenase accessory factor
MVLLDGKGLRHGVISGGCLEPALEDAAREVHESGRAAVVEFDTRSDEDLLFGSGIGCRGSVRLLLLPLPPLAPLARALFSALDQGKNLHLALALNEHVLGAGSASFAAATAAPTLARWDREGRASDAQAPASLHFDITMSPRLLLLGAGPETAPLAAFARRLGWFVEVVEHRGRWAAFAQQASIDRLIDLAPEAAVAALAGERYDALLVMSHNYTIDLAWLRFSASTEAGYVGLLGPAARRDALLAELDADAHALLQSRLHGPVGLDLGGHGGEAVALAITAQLQQHFSARRRVAALASAVLTDA